MQPRLGVSGRIAAYFQTAQITPLLAVVALLVGLFAVLVTPREEEPQINVTMANVIIPFPGASVRDVEQMVAVPAEQVLAQIADVEHVMAVSRPGLAMVTVQFEVGVPRTEALVRLHDTLRANTDWLPRELGVGEPLIKPKGIDDVPIVTLTLFSRDPATGALDLQHIAHSVEAELKRVPCTREVRSHGGQPRMWKTGHSLIKKKMRETGALLGGEMSGHMFLKERWFGFDDGLYNGARLVEILSHQAQAADALFAGFPGDLATPEINVTVTDENKFGIIAALQAESDWGSDAEVATLDGVRVDYSRGWGLVRASNTTPVLVLRFEAEDAEELARIQAVFRERLQRVAPELTLPF